MNNVSEAIMAAHYERTLNLVVIRLIDGVSRNDYVVLKANLPICLSLRRLLISQIGV